MIDAKMSFMAQMRKALADTLTVEQMEKMVSAGMGVLDRFVMHEIATGEDGPDDLLESYVAAMQVEGQTMCNVMEYLGKTAEESLVDEYTVPEKCPMREVRLL